jgi:hypothetical protein
MRHVAQHLRGMGDRTEIDARYQALLERIPRYPVTDPAA